MKRLIFIHILVIINYIYHNSFLFLHFLCHFPLSLFYCLFLRIIAQKSVPKYCLKFAEDIGLQLHAKNLVNHFTAHLANLYDLNLISAPEMEECLIKVQGMQPRTP